MELLFPSHDKKFNVAISSRNKALTGKENTEETYGFGRQVKPTECATSPRSEMFTYCH
jgi:hypothetical protein